jgi:hypothetical protein
VLDLPRAETRCLMLQIQPSLRSRRSQIVRIVKKTLKRVVAFAPAIYFIPWVLLGYLVLGLIDVRRNTPEHGEPSTATSPATACSPGCFPRSTS